MQISIEDFFNRLPVYMQEGECGYFDGNNRKFYVTFEELLHQEFGEEVDDSELYYYLLSSGFRRYSDAFYLDCCEKCSECIPIRIPVTDFCITKSQRRVWQKNQDIEVTLVQNKNRVSVERFSNFSTDEKAFLFREYDFYHNGHKPDYKKMTIVEARQALEEMNMGYDGIWNMEYRLNGKLIGVAILDYVTNAEGLIVGLSSNYFYYDVSSETLKRSLGVFSVLKEIQLCLQLEIPYYYLGLYLPNCRKMNYKTNYRPFELFINGSWICFEKDDNEKNNNIDKNFLLTESGALRGIMGENFPPLEGVAEKATLGCVCSEGEASPSLNFIKLPKAGELYPEYPDIAFVTEDISLDLLYSAYMQGIFPWFNESDGDPVLWQCPDPRFVLPVEELHVSKSIKKFLKHTPYTYTMDTCFEEVMKQCGLMKRKGQLGTWIGPKMLEAYKEFYKAGFAHSFEVWHEGRLVGGFYGVLLGSVFCGESMFTIEPDSSKSAFVMFARAFEKCGGKLIDCQAYTDNMARYGAVEISRTEFLEWHEKLVKQPLKEDLKKLFLMEYNQNHV